LEFTNFGAIEEVLDVLETLKPETSYEARRLLVSKFVRAAGRIRVASFNRALVAGYWQEGASRPDETV
jgi:hypothetical protein